MHHFKPVAEQAVEKTHPLVAADEEFGLRVRRHVITAGHNTGFLILIGHQILFLLHGEGYVLLLVQKRLGLIQAGDELGTQGADPHHVFHKLVPDEFFVTDIVTVHDLAGQRHAAPPQRANTCFIVNDIHDTLNIADSSSGGKPAKPRTAVFFYSIYHLKSSFAAGKARLPAFRDKDSQTNSCAERCMRNDTVTSPQSLSPSQASSACLWIARKAVGSFYS